ncbi:HAD-IA family hydrolase [Thermithiobacillus plumbiphilus]|uniref:HAD-IA family hydrolase n=1 Tax=Thermithiobacillus plumbiphilus TaxID=1729899 RepID=A0ABU9D441_9PROT
MPTPRRAVLFDLDGTLADTAPDLAHALNVTLIQHDRPPLPLDQIRPVASQGARGLLKLGLGLEPGMSGFAEARQMLLDTYAANIARETALFPGMNEILAGLESSGTPWGVVTNKPDYLTRALLEGLGLLQRAAVVVSGDTLPVSKPDPAPILHAASLLDLPAASTLMIGDDRRDIQSAHGAGAGAWAALWGYIAEQDQPMFWEADRLLADVKTLHDALRESGYMD